VSEQKRRRPWWWWIFPWLSLRRLERCYSEALYIIAEQATGNLTLRESRKKEEES